LSTTTAQARRPESRIAQPTDVDEYIDAASPAAQPLLRELRRLILAAVPTASERISYGMPTYPLSVVHTRSHVA
jgi:hypothetical protein